MKMANDITRAGPADYLTIKDLLAACHLPHEDITPDHPGHFFVLNQDGNLVGMVGLEICGPYGLLRSLAVAESHRNQGFGAALTRHLEETARSCGIQALYLLTTTADSFFSRLGYEPVARASVPVPVQETAEFTSICPESAVCMVKAISSG